MGANLGVFSRDGFTFSVDLRSPVCYDIAVGSLIAKRLIVHVYGILMFVNSIGALLSRASAGTLTQTVSPRPQPNILIFLLWRGIENRCYY